MYGHERCAHSGLGEAQIVRARDLEGLAERVKRFADIAAPRAYVHETALGPTQRADVAGSLLQRERAQVRALRRVEIAEQVLQLRERYRFGELPRGVAQEREHRLSAQVRCGRLLELTEVGVGAADEMPEPRSLRRRARGEKALRLACLLERFARTPQVAKRLRRPEQPAGEAILVTRAAKLGDRVAVLRERALVVAANAMQQAAQEHDEREALLDPRRESVEPAPERRYLAGLEDALAVIADQLRRALVLAGLLQVSDRAIDVAPRQRALGVGAV